MTATDRGAAGAVIAHALGGGMVGTALANDVLDALRDAGYAVTAVAPTDNDLSATAAEHDGTSVGPERR